MKSKNWNWSVVFLLLFVFSGCSSDDGLSDALSDKYFIISLKEENNTHIDTRSSFMEEVDFIQILFFQNGEFKWSPSKQDLIVKDDKVYIPVTNETLLNQSYDLYVIANREINDLVVGESLDKLKELEIKESFPVDTEFVLMNGLKSDVLLDLSQPKLGTIVLNRVPAQIKLQATFDEKKFVSGDCNGEQIYQIHQLNLDLVRFNTKAFVWNEGRVNGTYADLENKENIALAKNKEDNSYINNAPMYSYPNQWGSDNERETYLLLTAELSKCGSSTSPIPYYYLIPIEGWKDGIWVDNTQLKSNTLYEINVAINELGSLDSNKPLLVKGNIVVKDWTTESIDTSIDEFNYLFVDPLKSRMFDIDTKMLSFDSSLPDVKIKDINVYADFFNVKGEPERKKYNPDNSGEVEFGDPNQYPKFTMGSNTIEVSLNPSDNNLEKVIEFTVSNGIDELDQHVRIDQIPDISINTYRSEKAGIEILAGDVDITWILNLLNWGGDTNPHSVYNIIINVPKGQIVKYPPIIQKQVFGITYKQTSEDLEVINMISPNFITSSTKSNLSFAPYGLGKINGRTAANMHCHYYYEEVTINGKTEKYRGFRLPTKEEMKLIAERQYNNDILFVKGNNALLNSTDNYWTAENVYSIKQGELKEPFRTLGFINEARVICVRDLEKDK